MSETTLLKNFAVMASAPNGVTKLRELILTLAVQGKLVLQDLADEPASALLDRILAYKKSSQVKGKGRRGNTIQEVSHDEKP